MRRKPRMALVVTSFGLCSACAQQTARIHRAAAGRDTAWQSDVVTVADLASGGDGRSVLAALQVSRPLFLGGTRGRPPAVSVDDWPVTDLSILAMLSVSAICEIRLQRATSGAGHPVILSNGAVSGGGDVLLVRTRRQGTTDCRRDPVSPRRSERGQ